MPPTDTAVTDASEVDTDSNELTDAEIAAAAGIAGGAALLGSLLMLGATGVRREEALQAIRDLLRGHVPEDPFEAWKRKYEALGWKYSEKNGVATFDPVDGARNEGGEIYSAERGGFVRPAGETPPAPPPLPRDGDVNERGEVWSDYSPAAIVGRKTYEQDKASQAWLADKAKSRPRRHAAARRGRRRTAAQDRRDPPAGRGDAHLLQGARRTVGRARRPARPRGRRCACWTNPAPACSTNSATAC